LLDFASTDGTKATADIESIAKAKNFFIFSLLYNFLVKNEIPKNRFRKLTRNLCRAAKRYSWKKNTLLM